jgi:phosphoribosylformylglycinamidine synthase
MDIYLLGREEITLAGSEWAYLHNQRGGAAPKADLGHEARLVDLLLEGQELFASAHDLSMGGLAASIVEAILKNRIGATIELSSISEALFSETPGRVLVAVDPSNSDALMELSELKSINCKKIGVTGGSELNINNAVKISIADLSKFHTEVFPKLFGNSESVNRLSA